MTLYPNFKVRKEDINTCIERLAVGDYTHEQIHEAIMRIAHRKDGSKLVSNG